MIIRDEDVEYAKKNASEILQRGDIKRLDWYQDLARAYAEEKPPVPDFELAESVVAEALICVKTKAAEDQSNFCEDETESPAEAELNEVFSFLGKNEGRLYDMYTTGEICFLNSEDECVDLKEEIRVVLEVINLVFSALYSALGRRSAVPEGKETMLAAELFEECEAGECEVIFYDFILRLNESLADCIFSSTEKRVSLSEGLLLWVCEICVEQVVASALLQAQNN